MAILPFSSKYTSIKLFVVVMVAVILVGCDLLPRPPPPTSADYCDVKLMPAAPDDVTLSVWAPDARQHCLRLYAPVIAAMELPGISVSAVEKNINVDPFRELINSAIAEQAAPDLAFFHNGSELRKLVDDGYIYPLSKCGLPDEDWTNAIFPEREWAHPFEVEVLMLFYSKRILRDLGWESSSIEDFPKNIASGAVTLEDLLTIARHAIDAGVVKKGFAFTVHEGRFYSVMHFFKSFGGSYTGNSENLANSKDKLLETYRYYEELRNYGLMHPAISQAGYSNVSNRFAIRDALANGRILFAHTVVSEWKRMLLDHVASKSELQDNIGIALFPASSSWGSAMLSDMGSYVIFSEKATGKTNQLASCKVVRSIANSDLHRQHAINTSQLAPEAEGIWTPPDLPEFKLEVLHDGNQSHPQFSNIIAHVSDMTALLARSRVSADQAAALTARQMHASVR